MVTITEVRNNSEAEVHVSLIDKEQVTLATYESKNVSWEVPEIKDDADYWKGIEIYRWGSKFPAEKIHFWDNADYNLKFRDEFSGTAVNTYPLHIEVHWFKDRNIKIIVFDEGFEIRNDNCEAFLGYYPEDKYGGSLHEAYSIQPGKDGSLIVVPI